MTRRDYIALAQALGRAAGECRACGHANALDALEAYIAEVSCVCAAQSTAFNPRTFARECRRQAIDGDRA